MEVVVVTLIVLVAVVIKTLNTTDLKQRAFQRFVRHIAQQYQGTLDPNVRWDDAVHVDLMIRDLPMSMRFYENTVDRQLELIATISTVDLSDAIPQWFNLTGRYDQLHVNVDGQRWQGYARAGWLALFPDEVRADAATNDDLLQDLVAREQTALILGGQSALIDRLQYGLFYEGSLWRLTSLKCTHDEFTFKVEHHWINTDAERSINSCPMMLNVLVESLTTVIDNLPASPWAFWLTIYLEQPRLNSWSLAALTWMVRTNFHRNDVQRYWGEAVEKAPVESLVEPALANPTKTLPVIRRAKWKSIYFFDFFAHVAEYADLSDEHRLMVGTMCVDALFSNEYKLATSRHARILIDLVLLNTTGARVSALLALAPTWLKWMTVHEGVRWIEHAMAHYPDEITGELFAGVCGQLARTAQSEEADASSRAVIDALQTLLQQDPERLHSPSWTYATGSMLHTIQNKQQLELWKDVMITHVHPKGLSTLRKVASNQPRSSALRDVIEALEDKFEAAGATGSLTLTETLPSGRLSISTEAGAGQLTEFDGDDI